jgi:hypothetical protein
LKKIYKYINEFFNDLEIWEDINNKAIYKQKIMNSVTKFMDNPNAETVFDVYENFFDLYWIGIQDEKNPFIELVEKMRNYEVNSGQLLKKQRDHYVHSVYVFILGICFYQVSEKYKKTFNKVILDKSIYPDCYDTCNEEFFYRWGIASLFHDIAYPLEITINQANRYLEFISSYAGDESEKRIKAKLEIVDINNFNELPRLIPKEIFEKEFEKKYPSYNSKALKNSIYVLSNHLSKCFNINFCQIRDALYKFEATMQSESFIDHGYYSALIVMNWYYYLIQKTKWNPAYFYFPIVDIASAILLHNYYKHGLTKAPFNLKCMSIEQHPIAYLLILCDELQEWNRPGYGEEKPILELNDFDIILDETFTIIYKVKEGDENKNFILEEGDKFIRDRKSNILNLLNINDLFDNGIEIKLEGNVYG